MLKTSFKHIAIAVLCAGIFGCSGEADEAKKLGFSSVEEMKDVHAKGWHTRQQYYKDNPSILEAKKAELYEKISMLEAKKAELNKEKQVRNKKEDAFDSAIEVAASVVYNDFQANKMAAKDKYSNAPTLISGLLGGIDEDRDGKHIELTFSHDTSALAQVIVHIPNSGEQRARAMKLSKGDFVRVGCNGDVRFGIFPSLYGCALTEAPSKGDSPIKVDSLTLAFDQRAGGAKVSQYVGKLIETEIFVEGFVTNNGSKRLIDANSGFFCDIDSSQSSTFPDKRGGYVIRGTLIQSAGEIGLSRCQYVSSQ